MMARTNTRLLLLVLAAGLAGCNDLSSPTPPSPLPRQTVPPAAGHPPGFFYGNGYTLTGVTLFGVVSETTPTGQAPLADVSVYCDACGVEGHTWLRTDANGYYSFSGALGAGGGIWLSSGPTVLLVAKEGFADPAEQPGGSGVDSRREVTINGDTRYDIQLVRR